jgi:sterol 3beta-glucosyltransferase
MRILLLTIGTRGDVQPFIALGERLKQNGHDVALCTSSSFSSFVERQGLEYRYLNNDFVELAQGETGRRAMEESGGLAGRLRWMAEAARLFKPIFRKTLREEWEVAQDAEVIIYNPQSVGGFHIAEALGVPGIMADALPTWVPTGAFPSFAVPDLRLGKWYNRMTYRLLPLGTGGMFGSVVRQWRSETLKLPPRSRFGGELARSDGRPVPVLYSFSRHVLPPPADWPEHINVTGYWVLDETQDWRPPPELLNFLEAGPPPVFVGFGSMGGRDPARTTRLVLEALARAGQRGLLVTGWGGLETEKTPENALMVENAPYSWLFPRMAAVVHHGGAGTTGAGLQAGKPTVICPFVADQPFWGRRVAALGAGPPPIPQRKLTADNLASAIRQAVTDARMRQRAVDLGEKIRAEDGAGQAASLIEKYAAER